MDGIKAHSLELTLLSRHFQQQRIRKANQQNEMKLLLLVICCMISASLAGLIDKEAKLETVLK